MSNAIELQEGQALDTLLQAYQNIPQNDIELLRAIQKDISDTGGDLFKDLARSTPPGVLKTLTGLLSQSEVPDPAVLDQLIGELSENSLTYLRYYSALRERIEQNPQVKNRILSRVQIIQKDLAQKKVKFFVPGERFVNSMGMIMSIIGCAYAFKVSFIPEAENVRMFADGFFWMPGAFALIIGTSLTGEFLATKAGMMRSLESLKALWKSRRVIKNLRILTQELINDPEVKGLGITAKYFISGKANEDFQRLLPIILRQRMSEIEDIQSDPYLWNSLLAFSKTQEFLEIIRTLNASLTATDKHLLAQEVGLNESSKLWSVNQKLVRAESSLFESFFQFVRQSGDPLALENLKKYISKQRSDSMEIAVSVSEPKSSYNKIMGLSSLGIAIFGLVGAYGPHQDGLDPSFGLGVAQWVRFHSQMLIYSAGLLNIPGLALFYWKVARGARRASWIYKKLLAPFSDEVMLQAMSNAVEKLTLNDAQEFQGRDAFDPKNLPTTIEELIEKSSESAVNAALYSSSSPLSRIPPARMSCDMILLLPY